MEERSLNNMDKRHFHLIIICLFAALSFSACKKDGTNCLSSTGPVIRQERGVGGFDSIAVYNYVNLVLTQDSVNRVEVEAGQNILDGITTDVQNNTLILDNINRCNWLRSYASPVNVYVSVKNLSKIHYESSGNITSTNTITSGFLLIDVWGGCGKIDMDVNLYTGNIYEHLGTADITLRGRSIYTSVIAGDYGLLRIDQLISDFTWVANDGSNDCYVEAEKYLEASIGSIGNIYYTGEPDSLKVHITGTGELIHY
jgi:hypothetical protein